MRSLPKSVRHVTEGGGAYLDLNEPTGFDVSISREEMQTLSILDAIDENNRTTQRELSEATGLNLAKVNFLLRRLAEQGQLKLRNISKSPNKLKYLYVLTPRGIAEKSRLTLRFAKRTMDAYAQIQKNLQARLMQLKQIGVERLVLLGEGEVTDMVIDAVKRVDGLSVAAIVGAKSGGKRRGIPVLTVIDGIAYDRAIPCDDMEIYTEQLLVQSGIDKEKLWLM